MTLHRSNLCKLPLSQQQAIEVDKQRCFKAYQLVRFKTVNQIKRGIYKMKIETIQEVVSRYPSKLKAAESLGVPANYVTRWLKYDVVFIDGVPYKKLIEIKRL